MTLSDFSDLVQTRRSVRAYRPDPVPEETLRAVLDAAHWAPSACNRQPWRFLVLRDAAARERLANAYSRDWFRAAPVLVAVCVRPADGWVRPFDGQSYAWVDGSIAMDHLTLAAAAAGLGTCWIGAFDPDAARAALELPDGWEIVALTPLGFPAPETAPRPRTRKPLADVLAHP